MKQRISEQRYSETNMSFSAATMSPNKNGMAIASR